MSAKRPRVSGLAWGEEREVLRTLAKTRAAEDEDNNSQALWHPGDLFGGREQSSMPGTTFLEGGYKRQVNRVVISF